MSDKVSLSKKSIQSIENFERVALRALEAADRVSFRLFVYALALWDIYRYFAGKH
jgi:hypothetical protein